MKRFKISALALVAFFVVFTSFHERKHDSSKYVNGLLFKWYEYNGWGDPYDPESYSALSEAPSCNSDGTLCSVFAIVDLLNSNHPTVLSLVDLGLSSCCFTQQYTGILGRVRLQHD